MHKDFIFREYDIRGVYEKDFDLSFAEQLAKSLTSFIVKRGKSKPLITVGYDARLSSPDIERAVVRGLESSGADVVALGLITTPISYFSMFHLNADGGIMITGSHNPPDYNGFKISYGKSTLFGEEIQELGRLLRSSDFVTGKGSVKSHDIFPAYVEKYQKEFSQLKNIPVVLDCGNGAAGCIARRLYEAIGLKPDILFEKPDGRFPNHHPDPTVEENLKDLKARVIATSAKVGIGFDGDCDRIGVVDSEGRFLLGDELMVIWSRDILKKSPGAKIIGDVKCTDRLYADIAKNGGQPIMWKTGHSLIKNKIKEEKAPFGGELSGHIFFADRNYGYDDALYAGLRLIEILSETGLSLKKLLDGVPPAFNTPEIRLDTTEEKKKNIVEQLSAYFRKQPNVQLNFIDGVRVSYPDGWALVRASNTQPVVVVRFESQTQERLNEIKSTVLKVIEPLL
ncbi:phosphomannomutase/phosphoglucomutase [bacterium]|nr:phosphomannomutase/phosphoglucomutase [bacterium]